MAECDAGNLSPLVVFVEGGVCSASAVMFEGLVFVVGRSLKTSFFFPMLSFSRRREASFGSREAMVLLPVCTPGIDGCVAIGSS